MKVNRNLSSTDSQRNTGSSSPCLLDFSTGSSVPSPNVPAMATTPWLRVSSVRASVWAACRCCTSVQCLPWGRGTSRRTASTKHWPLLMAVKQQVLLRAPIIRYQGTRVADAKRALQNILPDNCVHVFWKELEASECDSCALTHREQTPGGRQALQPPCAVRPGLCSTLQRHRRSPAGDVNSPAKPKPTANAQ